MEQIRTAIIGYGRSGSTMHANSIAVNPRFRVVAVCDIDQERQLQARSRFDCRIYDDYRQMLKSEDLDLAVIVTRNDQHAGMTIDCLEAGAHVLVTKPWAVNPDEARRMMSAWQSSGKLLLPWLPARWGCDLRRLGELMAEKAIGNLFFIRRTVSSFATRSDWQTESKHGGGYLLNWGPHIVDPPLVLAGSPVRSVFGRLAQVINPGDVEDMFHSVITLEDGTLVQTEYTICAETLPSWILQGDRGTIIVKSRSLRMIRHNPTRPSDPTAFDTMKAQKPVVVEEELQGEPYGDPHEVYRAVEEAVTAKKSFPVTPQDAMRLTLVLDAIRESAMQNRVIMLES